jgi:peroxygenase
MSTIGPTSHVAPTPDDDDGAPAAAPPAPPPPAAPAPAPGGKSPMDVRTALQKHVEFFDFDGDGRISPDETRMGLNALGMTGAQNLLTRSLINGTFGPPTTGSQDVSVADIEKAIHPGDTGAFDANGNFDKPRFDRIWNDFDKNKDGKLTEDEIATMTDANSTPRTFGRVATKGEFKLLMNLAGQDDPKLGRVVTRERLQAFYDGTLFDKIVAERTGMPADLQHSPASAGGGVASVARSSGGPLAGRASGAGMGSALLTDDPARSAAVSPAIVGAMAATCPYLASVKP